MWENGCFKQYWWKDLGKISNDKRQMLGQGWFPLKFRNIKFLVIKKKFNNRYSCSTNTHTHTHAHSSKYNAKLSLRSPTCNHGSNIERHFFSIYYTMVLFTQEKIIYESEWTVVYVYIFLTEFSVYIYTKHTHTHTHTYTHIYIYISRDLPVFAVCRVKLYRHNHSAPRTLPGAIFRAPVDVTSLANTVFAWKFNGSICQVSFTKYALCNFTGKTITKKYKLNLCVTDKLATWYHSKTRRRKNRFWLFFLVTTGHPPTHSHNSFRTERQRGL